LVFVLSSTNAVFAEDYERGDKYISVRGKIQECFACHGETGAPLRDKPDSGSESFQRTGMISGFPILAGQEFYYLYVQLKDFKSGLRENEIMGQIVSSLEKEQMKLIAEYFSEQEWPVNGFKAETAQIEIGKKVVAAAECPACHLGSFTGNSRVPRVAGQDAEYLTKTMLDLKNKTRKNAAAMASIMATFSDEEIKAVAAYLAGFKPENQ